VRPTRCSPSSAGGDDRPLDEEDRGLTYDEPERTSGSGDLAEVPDETGGPYPGDGSNGVNVLDDSGIVRSDIRSSFGSSTTTAEGVPLNSPGVEGENFLRGVQETDSSGTVEFTTVFPGCYSGRWPHIHFEVYGGVDDAVSSGPIVKTSQIALPQEACEAVYATSGYEASVPNLAGTSLARDMVFADDGGIHQTASMSGDADEGYVAALTIGV
jgi:protocatechuate 3,4-dioxygenase beta subunit